MIEHMGYYVMQAVYVAALIALFCVAFGISFGLAKLGHPSAIWFWRDIIGVL